MIKGVSWKNTGEFTKLVRGRRKGLVNEQNFKKVLEAGNTVIISLVRLLRTLSTWLHILALTTMFNTETSQRKYLVTGETLVTASPLDDTSDREKVNTGPQTS